jgi:hypothetical protein
MPRVGFETTTQMFQSAKTFHDGAAILIGLCPLLISFYGLNSASCVGKTTGSKCDLQFPSQHPDGLWLWGGA